MIKGERWVPKTDRPGGFTVVSVSKDVVEVAVDRLTKDGEIITNPRVLTSDVLPFLLRGYQKEGKKK